MMDCDTTGVELDFSLVKSKKLVGGGEITIVNKTVPMALDKLGYAPNEVEEVVAYIDERNTIVGAPKIKHEHYPIFDCAIGERAIHYMGHVKMMGAVQPFISGAISKTVNLPDGDRGGCLQPRGHAWRLGVKAIAIPRRLEDGAAAVGKGEAATPPVPLTQRRRLRRTASRSAASSRSATTRATSTSACTRTGRRATSSWTSRRRARRWPGS